MEKKYGDIIKETYPTRQGETKNLNRKVRDINAAIKLSIKDKIESGLKPSRLVRKEDLKIVGNWQPKAPPGKVTHHFMPLAGVEGESLNLASTKNTAFISEELNSKMAPYNTKLKANQKEQIKLLKEKPKGWEKRIEELNFKAKNIYKEAAKKVPGSSGYLGYSQYIKQPEGSYVPKVTGIDSNKSLAGLKGEEIFYKNITKENQLKVNKMSNIKLNQNIPTSENIIKLNKSLSDKKIKSVLKNLDISYNPGISFMGAAGLDDLLKTVPAAKVGKFIKGIGLEFEPLFEGAFYEYFRRKGYTHDQAREETFFYKLANPDRTGILEGADPLLEKDLYQIKDEKGKVIGERESVKRYIDTQKALEEAQNKYSSLSSAYSKATTSGRGRTVDLEGAEQYKTQAEKVWEEIKGLEKELNLGQDTYRAAVEKQQTEQGVKGIEYGEWGQGDTERLAARRDKERVRLMNKKFPSYTGPQVDQKLEQYGYYINPNNRYRPKAKSLELIEGVGYDDISDYFKDQDKTAYFAENFREEKAGGGKVEYDNSLPNIFEEDK